jgi:hypothetical protein
MQVGWVAGSDCAETWTSYMHPRRWSVLDQQGKKGQKEEDKPAQLALPGVLLPVQTYYGNSLRLPYEYGRHHFQISLRCLNCGDPGLRFGGLVITCLGHPSPFSLLFANPV